jgi:DNA-binding Lrp family transcriptional regulator
MQAYVLIALDSAREQQIYEEIKDMEGIKDAHILFGEWDMVAKLELENPEALSAFVIQNIRAIPGVRLTSTMIVAK